MTTIPNMAGKGMTVRGPINPSEIGSTLMHEHVLVAFKIYNEPSFHTPASEMALWDQKVALDNLHLARESKPLRDNLLYADERLATDEAVYFRDAGGNTIVDVANNGIRRDPLGLRRSSYAAGVNIVMSCGWYQKWYHPQDMDQRTVEDMTDEIIRDITVGGGETGIRSGIIGEVGIDGDPITPDEIKSIKAAARASKATGAAISFHRSGVGRNEQLQVVGAVAEEGADLTRTILGHSDFIAMDMPLMKELLELGPFIQFDLLGKLGTPLMHQPPTPVRVSYGPRPPTRRGGGWSFDILAAEAIIEFIEIGYEDRILLSHDCAPKVGFRSYGGTGWAFILERFLPHLRTLGVTEQQIDKIIVENPKRALTFAEPG